MARARRGRRAATLLIALACTCVQARAQADSAGAALVEQARQAAGADRNAEAADLFGRAIEHAPERRREVLRELADQLTYSGRAEQAIPLYREVLAFETEPRVRRWTRLGLALALSWTGRLAEAQREYETLIADDAAEVDARLGRARVLAWQERLAAARDEYRRILERNPETPEARRELARVQWWRGRPRQAKRRLLDLLADNPDDADARLLLGEVQASLGRPDLARAGARSTLARNPGAERARVADAELAQRTRPTTRVQQYASEQSDGVDIRTTLVEQRFRPGGGRSDAELRYEFRSYAPESGAPGVRVHRPGVYGRHRVSDDLELNGSAHAELVRPGGGAPHVHEASFDAWATYWPADIVRVDLSARRDLFDDVRSITRGITGTYAGLSVDLTPSEKARLTGRGSMGRISDGNRRRWGQLETEYRVWNHPRTLVGARFTAIDFLRGTGNGYFEPQDFRAAAATLRLYDQIAGRFWWDLEGSYGREDTRTDEPKPIWSTGARGVPRHPAHRDRGGVPLLQLAGRRERRFCPRRGEGGGAARLVTAAPRQGREPGGASDDLLDRLSRVALHDREAIRELSAEIRRIPEAIDILGDLEAAITSALARLGEQVTTAQKAAGHRAHTRHAAPRTGSSSAREGPLVGGARSAGRAGVRDGVQARCGRGGAPARGVSGGTSAAAVANQPRVLGTVRSQSIGCSRSGLRHPSAGDETMVTRPVRKSNIAPATSAVPSRMAAASTGDAARRMFTCERTFSITTVSTSWLCARSTAGRMYGYRLPICPGTASPPIVAFTAPHALWPSTSTSLAPSTAVAYSRLPMISELAMFPATRATKMSPKP